MRPRSAVILFSVPIYIHIYLDFLQGGANPKGGGVNVLFWPFPRKMHEPEKEIWMGREYVPAVPLGSANEGGYLSKSWAPDILPDIPKNNNKKHKIKENPRGEWVNPEGWVSQVIPTPKKGPGTRDTHHHPVNRLTDWQTPVKPLPPPPPSLVGGKRQQQENETRENSIRRAFPVVDPPLIEILQPIPTTLNLCALLFLFFTRFAHVIFVCKIWQTIKDVVTWDFL